jgi:hypothetical protein
MGSEVSITSTMIWCKIVLLYSRSISAHFRVVRCGFLLNSDTDNCLLKQFQYIVVFSDICAVTMTVCWHYLLFHFSNFEFPNLAI